VISLFPNLSSEPFWLCFGIQGKSEESDDELRAMIYKQFGIQSARDKDMDYFIDNFVNLKVKYDQTTQMAWAVLVVDTFQETFWGNNEVYQLLKSLSAVFLEKAN
jgi:hypothetical protein